MHPPRLAVAAALHLRRVGMLVTSVYIKYINQEAMAFNLIAMPPA